MDTPLVSVIVAVYNGQRFLGEALASILAQDYRPLEILVVDDGSTDASAEIAQSFVGVQYTSQANQGAAVARNAGVSQAKGELLAFLDQDDVWLPNKLSLQVEYLRAHPLTLYVICHMLLQLEPGVQLPASYDQNLLLHPTPGFLPSALLARRTAFDSVGLFDPSYRFGSDSDWFFRATDLGLAPAIMPEMLVQKRMHEDNQGHSFNGTKTDLFRLLRSSIKRKRQP